MTASQSTTCFNFWARWDNDSPLSEVHQQNPQCYSIKNLCASIKAFSLQTDTASELKMRCFVCVGAFGLESGQHFSSCFQDGMLRSTTASDGFVTVVQQPPFYPRPSVFVKLFL